MYARRPRAQRRRASGWARRSAARSATTTSSIRSRTRDFYALRGLLRRRGRSRRSAGASPTRCPTTEQKAALADARRQGARARRTRSRRSCRRPSGRGRVAELVTTRACTTARARAGRRRRTARAYASGATTSRSSPRRPTARSQRRTPTACAARPSSSASPPCGSRRRPRRAAAPADRAAIANGGFVLSEIEVRDAADGRCRSRTRAPRRRDGDGYSAAAAIDGDTQNGGWALAAADGERATGSWSSWPCRSSARARRTTLTLVVHQNAGGLRTLGRLRLAATSDPLPVRTSRWPGRPARTSSRPPGSIRARTHRNSRTRSRRSTGATRPSSPPPARRCEPPSSKRQTLLDAVPQAYVDDRARARPRARPAARQLARRVAARS